MTSDHTRRAKKTTADNSAEFLDRHPWLPLTLLLLLPFAIHAPLWLLGISTDPIQFVGKIAKDPSLIAGYPFIDPNVGVTSQALGRLVASDWVHGIVPWWNPYTGVGMPLAGELQPAAFFFPFNLLFLLPDGVLWQQISMQIIAGLTMYALLRELKFSRLAALMGGSLYALNAVFAWSPGPAAVYCSLPFQPLLIWGIERARKHSQGAVSILAIGASIAWSLLAGFPEPAYISGLLALGWGLYRLYQTENRWAMGRRCMLGFALGILVAAPPLVAFVDYIQQSDSFRVHNSGDSSLPWTAFSPTVFPYIYGTLAKSFSSKPLSQIWGSIGGYIGLPVILLAVVGMVRSSALRGLKILLSVWVVACWGKTFGLQPFMWIINHLPLLRQAAFFRYSPASWIFAFVVLAAFGLDEFRDGSPKRRAAFLVTVSLLIVAIALAWPQRELWARPHTLVPLMLAIWAVTVAWNLAALVAAAFAWSCPQTERRRTMLACLLVADAAMCFAMPFLSATHPEPADTRAIQFLCKQQGLSRNFTLGPLQPNYGAYFKLASVDHNVLPVPRLWSTYIDQDLGGSLVKSEDGVTFWPSISNEGNGERALGQNLSGYLNLGTRYIITYAGRSPSAMTKLVEGEKDNVSSMKVLASRLSFLLPLMKWSRSAVNDSSESAFKRKLAGVILRRGSFLTVDSDTGSNQESIAGNRGGKHMLILPSRQPIRFSVAAPSSTTSEGHSSIDAIGVTLSGGSAYADGDLKVEICVAATCASGHRSFSKFADEMYLDIQLSRSVPVSSGSIMNMIFTRNGGSDVVALKTGSLVGSHGEIAQVPDDLPELAVQYGPGLPGIHRVYEGPTIDIWELPHHAPYFQVTQGGPCTVSTQEREHVTVECSAPATLLRRELFMPGWRAKVNGRRAANLQQAGIFQAVALPAGRSQVRFRFVPPYMTLGWIACFAGIAGLLWQVVVIRLERRPRAQIWLAPN